MESLINKIAITLSPAINGLANTTQYGLSKFGFYPTIIAMGLSIIGLFKLRQWVKSNT